MYADLFFINELVRQGCTVPQAGTLMDTVFYAMTYHAWKRDGTFAGHERHIPMKVANRYRARESANAIRNAR